MLRHGAHGIVGNSCGCSVPDPGWVGKEGVEAAVAAIIEVEICAAIEGENKVTDCVGALDRKGIVVKSVQEPGVFCFNKLAGFLVGPELDFR